MTLASRFRAARIGALVLLAAVGLADVSPATARDILSARAPTFETPDIDVDVPDVETPDIATPRLPGTKGALVFHGNYCGPGSRGVGLPPVDALDEACMHHDACSPPVGTGLPPCSCNARLTREAALVARRPDTPDDVRVAAEFVASGAKVLACR